MSQFKFSVGPWNVHPGADSYGPATRADILAGLDPANEIGFALAMGKLMTVHLNDQNGIRYDQDKSFGVENLRAAFNQVKVLKENGYGSHGEYVGLDVKAMRTTKDEDSYKHLENRNFEALKMYVMNLLMGIE